MSVPSVPSVRSRSLLYAVLGFGAAVGLVASLLAASAPPAPRPQAGELLVNLPLPVWGLLFLSPFLVGFGAIIFRRLTEPSATLSGRTQAFFAVVLVLAVLFVALMVWGGLGNQGSVSISRGTPPPPGPPIPPPNNSTNTSNTTNSTNTTNLSVTHFFTITLSAWELVAVLAGVSACVVALAIPGVVSWLVDRRQRGGRAPPPDREQVRAALADAGAALARGEDARETVVRLYVRLLYAIVPRVGDVSCLTAEEIRRQALAGLGVGAAASEALTRLFEEARYSSHPIGSAEAERFQTAIRQVEADLLRGIAS